MNHPHPVGIVPIDREKTEGTSPKFDPGFIRRAQEKTVEVTREVRDAIREGMTELEARKMAVEIFRKYGVTKHWHQPYIRFGAGTTLTFHEPLQADYRLKSGDAFYVDLGPVWSDSENGIEYEGDYGDTFVLGENEEAETCARTPHEASVFAERVSLGS